MSATSRGLQGRRRFGRLPHRCLKAGQGKIGVRPADHRPRQRKTFRIAALGGGLERRTAGIRKTEQFGSLVECFADGVVDSGSESIVIAHALDCENLGVAARRQQYQKGKGDAGGETRRQRMRLEMVDSEERLADRDRDPLGRHQPDQHASDQARSRRRRDAVEISRRHPRLRERARDQQVDDLDMGARRDLRHNPAVGRMSRNLTHHFVGQDLTRAVRP